MHVLPCKIFHVETKHALEMFRLANQETLDRVSFLSHFLNMHEGFPVKPRCSSKYEP